MAPQFSLRFYFICAVIFSFQPSFSYGQREGYWKKRLYVEGPAGWEKMRQSVQKMEGLVSGTYNSLGSKSITLKNWKFKKNDDLFLYNVEQIIPEETKPFKRVGGVNSKYYFFLKGNQDGTAWTLRSHGMEPLSRWSVGHPHAAAWVHGLIKYMEGSWSIIGMPLSEMIKEPGFKVLKISEENRGAELLVKVHFSYQPPAGYIPKKNPKGGYDTISYQDIPVRGGWILFHPGKNWAIYEFEADSPGLGIAAGQNEYGNEEPFSVPPKKMALKISGPDGKGSSYVWETKELRFNEISEEEFTLSAYNLPEPIGVHWPSKRRWYLWFLAMAAASLALGYYFRRRMNQRGLTEKKPEITASKEAL